MEKEISDSVEIPDVNSIGRPMESHEKKYFWTRDVEGVDIHDVIDLANAQRLEEQGYALVGSAFSDGSDHTGNIVTPEGRVLTSSEIEKLSDKNPYDKNNEFSRIIHSAGMYKLLSD